MAEKEPEKRVDEGGARNGGISRRLVVKVSALGAAYIPFSPPAIAAVRRPARAPVSTPEGGPAFPIGTIECHTCLLGEWASALSASLATSPVHEEGGWVYQCPEDCKPTFRRAPAGGGAQIDLSNPPVIPGCFVIATYHTHPNPTPAFTLPPSASDCSADHKNGVPGVVIARGWDAGGATSASHKFNTHDDCPGGSTAAPERRNGGLSGNATFPNPC